MSAVFETVIGLEIHAELCTKEKLFCACANRFGEEPNTLCCPVCLGEPGSRPVLNEKAVESAVLMGHALGCRVNEVSHFDRKHYTYHDLPKGYQITQYAHPICEDGQLTFAMDGEKHTVGIERIQIEEDAGKLSYDGENNIILIDHNRCGVPLLEIVTRPDMRGAGEAKACMEALADILRALGISDVKMQEGSLRADINVSVRKKGERTHGERVEMKNINGFSAVYRAVQFEEERQRALVGEGKAIERETRRWDDQKNESTVMRGKEAVQDYRYMPEPDLPPLVLEPEYIELLRKSLPELPKARQQRYREVLHLPAQMAQVLAKAPELAAIFDAATELDLAPPAAIANWLTGDVLRALREMRPPLPLSSINPLHLAQLVALVEEGAVSGAAGKAILPQMLKEDVAPNAIARDKQLMQNTSVVDHTEFARGAIKENPGVVQDYRGGKQNALGYLVGRGMQLSRGRANPALLRDQLAVLLGEKSEEVLQ